MDNDWNAADQSMDAAVDERNNALSLQMEYYGSLHYVNLNTVNADAYYDSLKDRSEFKEPRDKSRKNAEKDSGISVFLKFKAMFSETSKNELGNKKKEAAILQKNTRNLFLNVFNAKENNFIKNKKIAIMLLT